MYKILLQTQRDLRNPQISWGDLSNLDEMEEILPRSRQDSETRKHHGEISTNLSEMEDILLQSRQDLESHKHDGKISTISARSRQSRRVFSNLGKMEDM